MKLLKLHISDELYQRIGVLANQASDSVEKVAIDTLDHHVGNGSFENRQLYGKHVSYANFDEQTELVNVNGIWYRFTIKDHRFVDPNTIYTIVAANGNQLVLATVND